MEERPWDSFSEADRAEFWATLALKYTPGIGPRTVANLLRYFGSALSCLENKDFWSDAKVSRDKSKLLASEVWRKEATEEWNNAQVCHAGILLWKDADYPNLLRTLIDAPSILYYKGNLDLLHSPCFAIVGSRKCSAEGVQVTAKFSRELSKAGLTIVSGMAQGIDRVAHMAALAHVGKSVGVLGTGIDVFYPLSNEDVYNKLHKEGLLLSEFAPQTKPIGSNFPIRNRIVSGLCFGVLVVEGMRSSGSLITARIALEQNREVYAVPGPTSAVISEGCHALIRQGAKPVFNADDVLCDLAPILTAHMQENSVNFIKKSTVTAPKASHVASHNVFNIVSQKSPKQQNNINNSSLPQEHNKVAISPPAISEQFSDFSDEEREYAQKILNFLQMQGKSHIDELCVQLNKAVSSVNALLIEMELLQLIKKERGGQYYSAISASLGG